MVTLELVDLAHGLGMKARSSGIATPQQMVEAAEIGCNGMTINWPDWLIDYVRTRTGTATLNSRSNPRAAGIPDSFSLRATGC